VESEARAAAATLPPGDRREELSVWVQPPLRRLPADWLAPPAAAPWRLPQQPVQSVEAGVVYEWASSVAMAVGSVVHRWLQVMADEGVTSFDGRRIESCRPAFRRMLERLGVGSSDLEQAVARVAEALVSTLQDERGRWILSEDHAEAANEMPLTLWEGSRSRSIVIDRTFLEEDGTRWIIDYKTSAHEGGDIEAFLELEIRRHHEQLLAYRMALSRLAPGPIRTALYFPSLCAFREITPTED
jgi:ATP-dependent exoDNAse (exonuclease V) beta subunit